MVSIANFQLIPKEILYDITIVPIIGEKDDDLDESDSLVKNVLWTLVIVIILGLLISLLVFCRRTVIPKCYTPVQTLVAIIEAKLMFNSVLRACLQTFLATFVSLLLSLKTLDPTSTEGAVDLILAILIAAYGLSLTVFSLKFLQRKFDSLRVPAFKQRYDSLYMNVDTQSRTALAFTFLYLTRRMLFAAVIAFCGSSIVLQVLLADILSTILLGFYWRVRPMVGFLNNALEIVNESLVLAAFWFLFLFTDYIENPEQRYKYGFDFLYLVAAVVVLNSLAFIYSLGSKVYFVVRRYCIRRQAQ